MSGFVAGRTGPRDLPIRCRFSWRFIVIRYLAGIGCLAALIAGSSARAQAPVPAPVIAVPYGDCRAGLWSSNRNLDDAHALASATCTLNWKQPLADNLRLAASARAGSRDRGATDRADGRVREAYLEADAGDWRLRAGRQQIVWGRADVFNPTDSLNPRDYTLLAADDEQQRLGIDALHLAWQVAPGWSLVSVVTRGFTPNLVAQGALPPNRETADRPRGGDVAIRLDHAGDRFDGAISWYRGHNRFARYGSVFDASGGLLFRSAHERATTLGADFSTTVLRWGVRGEYAHTRLAPVCDVCPGTPRSNDRWVLGIDRDLGDSANLNLSWFSIRRPGYVDPNSLAAPLVPLANALDRLNGEFGARENGVAVRLSDRLFNDRLRVELGVVRDLTHGSTLLRPRLSYSVNDSLRVGAGFDRHLGQPQSMFGYRQANNLAFTEVVLLF